MEDGVDRGEGEAGLSSKTKFEYCKYDRQNCLVLLWCWSYLDVKKHKAQVFMEIESGDIGQCDA